MGKKSMICVCLIDICTRDLRQKAERGKITDSEAITRFPRASCFEKPSRSVPEIWGRMYGILGWSAKGSRKQNEKSDSHAAKKGAKKLVSSNFAKTMNK